MNAIRTSLLILLVLASFNVHSQSQSDTKPCTLPAVFEGCQCQENYLLNIDCHVELSRSNNFTGELPSIEVLNLNGTAEWKANLILSWLR